MAETVSVRIKIDDDGSFKRVEVDAADLKEVIDALNSKKETMEDAAHMPGPVEALDTYREIEDAVSYYSRKLKTASAEERAEIQEVIDALNGKKEAMGRIASIPAMRKETVRLDGLDRQELAIELELIGLEGIKASIRSLQKMLKDTSNPLGDKDRKSVEEMIGSYKRYENILKKSSLTMNSGWGAVKGVGNSVKSLTQSLKGNGSAWDKISGSIDGVIGLYQSFGQVIGIIKTVTSLTRQSTAANERDAYQNMEDWCNFGYVPIRLTMRSADGTALWHYHNKSVLESNGYDHTKCGWKAGEADWGDAWLCYYDYSDRKAGTGFGGWKTNKPMIGYTRGGLPDIWEKIEDGEYIMLPSSGGFLELEIGEGVLQFDYQRKVKDIYKFVRWVMYKEPSITLCRRNYKEYESNDIVDSAWINRAAKEEYSIDTIVGTMPDNWGVPSARGALLKGNLSAYSSFARAGVEDRLERLLTGTVYSNYASRHDVLSGTVRLLPWFCICRDANTAGKFVVLSEVQSCMEDISEIKMVEFGEDNYEGVEYER